MKVLRELVILLCCLLNFVDGIQEPTRPLQPLRHDVNKSSSWLRGAPSLIAADLRPRADPAAKRHPVYRAMGAAQDLPERRIEFHFTKDSATYFCIIVLAMECMVVHTALSLSRNADELSGQTQPSLLTQTLTVAARSMAYPPMMCMLFVGCRMYILSTTEGQGEPQLWVKICMVASVIGMTMHLACVLAIPAFTAHWTMDHKETMRFDELAGESSDVHVKMESQPFDDENTRATFQSLQVFAAALVYASIAGVTIGMITYPQGTDRISVAVLGTIFLSVLYFSVYFVVWVGRPSATKEAYFGREEAYRFRSAGRQALLPIRKAPMIAVLFLVARLRELQLDPPHGMPSRLEEFGIVASCAAILFETVAALVIGFKGEERAERNGMPSYKYSEDAHMCLHFCGSIAYLSLVPVVLGVIFSDAPDGSSGPPLPATTSAVLQLALLYFIVNISQWLIFMMEDLQEKTFAAAEVVVVAADTSVRLCPLVSILFVACRLRALQLTEHRGHPQIWAQQAMFVSLLAILWQMLSCLALPLATGKELHCRADGDGFASWEYKPLLVAYVMTVQKYVALFCLHASILMIAVAIFEMTAESAHMRGETSAGLLEAETLKFAIPVAILSLFFALFVSFGKVLGIIFKLAVEEMDRTFIGCDIHIDKAAMSLCRGWVYIADVVVDNPGYPVEAGSATWTAPNLMTVKRVRADLDMVKLISSGGTVFEFEEILLEDVDVNYDKPWMVKDNVSCILDYMNAKRNKQPTPREPDPAPETAATKKIVFHKISIRNVTAQLFVSGPKGMGGQMNVALADLEFPDFAQQVKDEEVDMQQELMTFIVRSVMETVAANVGPGRMMTKGLQNAANQVAGCIQGNQLAAGCFQGIVPGNGTKSGSLKY
jgi:hypothetical protein